MKLTLQLRYSAILIGIVLLVVIIMGGILTWQLRTSHQEVQSATEFSMSHDLRAQLKNHGINAISYLTATTSDDLYNYNLSNLNRLLAAMRTQANVVDVYIFDNEGIIINDGIDITNRFGQAIPPAIVSTLNKHPTAISTLDSPNKQTFAQYIYVGDSIIGGIVLELSTEGIKSNLQEMNSKLNDLSKNQLESNLLTITLTAIGLIITSTLLASSATKVLILPIKKLSLIAQKIGKGNYDVRIDTRRKDEIGDLAQSFVEMRNNLKSSAGKITQLAHQDSLTNLPNRRTFQIHLDHLLAKKHRRNEHFALLYIDLDDFKSVNDTLGHDVGDELLIEASERLFNAIRSEDIACLDSPDSYSKDQSSTLSRLGGDEFTVLLADITHPIDAAIAATRIIESISKPYLLRGSEVVIGTSIGITIFPNDGTTATDLQKNADLALYQSKSNGKNQYHFFTAALHTAAQEKTTIGNDLRNAIDNNELEIYYQPQIDLDTEHIIGLEALLRWKHPQNGFIGPDVFIPIAENNGLIIPIGEWIINQVFQQLAQWKSSDIDNIPVAINISGIQFRQKNISNMIIQSLDRLQIDANLIQIEVTETALVQDTYNAKNALHELSNAGIKIWLDDFGTGFSSLSQLRQFPVDGVKIDRQFIQDITNSKNDHSLCKAIISMAEHLNIAVVAEGIETREQADILRDHNCTYGQGYYFAKPMPASACLTFIKQSQENYCS